MNIMKMRPSLTCLHMYTCRITVCECMCTCWHMHSTCSYLWVNSHRHVCGSFFADLISIQTPSVGTSFYQVRVRVNLLTPMGDLCYSLIPNNCCIYIHRLLVTGTNNPSSSDGYHNTIFRRAHVVQPLCYTVEEFREIDNPPATRL